MDRFPLVSIIVLTWNGKEDTVACLKSLRAITYPNVKIILVDNASADGTAEAVRSLYPDVAVVVNGSNLRFAGGNNVGIRKALEEDAEYVLLLNNDTTADKDFLSRLVAAAGADERAGMAGPKIYYHADKERIWYAGGRITWWNGTTSHEGIRERDHGGEDDVRETGYITGCCLLVKREVIERIGLLDESYYIYGEDADWSVRASRAGYALLYVPGALIWHKVSVSTGGHFSWFKNWNKLKSQLRFMARYAKPYHWLTIPFLMPVSILYRSVASKRARRPERG